MYVLLLAKIHSSLSSCLSPGELASEQGWHAPHLTYIHSAFVHNFSHHRQEAIRYASSVLVAKRSLKTYADMEGEGFWGDFLDCLCHVLAIMSSSFWYCVKGYKLASLPPTFTWSCATSCLRNWYDHRWEKLLNNLYVFLAPYCWLTK